MTNNSIVLQNKNLTIEIDKPGAVYRSTRFDWTGFIRQITFKNNITFCTTETGNTSNIQLIGAGLCNEFGITQPVGYNTCPVGQQFTKIGVGLLTRESADTYNFRKQYPLTPAKVEWVQKSQDKIAFVSQTQITRGYAYKLEKIILLEDNCLTIKYALLNTGTETIDTNEYCHNFLSFNRSKITADDELQLTFPIETNNIKETVNPKGVVNVGNNTFNWKDTPIQDFFFSNVGKPVNAKYNWKLINKHHAISIEELVCPIPQKMNIWGNAHVISPEMFIPIHLKPGETFQWQRIFTFSEFP